MCYCRGAATVANLATPRSAVATAIRAPAGVGVVATPQSIGGGGFVSTVRQVTPVARTPSPAAGTWLAGNMNMQLQNQQIVKGVVGATSASASNTAALQQRISTVVGRTQIITRTTPSTTNAGVGVGVGTGAGPGPGPGVGTSATSTPLTSVAGQLRHSTIIGGQPQPPIHAFKTTLAQVLHARPQTLVYSAGSAQAQAAQAQHHHFMARSQVRQLSGTAITTVAVAAAVTTTTTIAATATTTPSSSSSSNSSNRPLVKKNAKLISIMNDDFFWYLESNDRSQGGCPDSCTRSDYLNTIDGNTGLDYNIHNRRCETCAQYCNWCSH